MAEEAKTMKIVVPTAGVVPAKQNADYIMFIARKMEAEVIAIHIRDYQEDRRGEEALQVFVDAGINFGIPVRTFLLVGGVVENIIETCEKERANLIIMDPRGQHSGLSRYATHVLNFKPAHDVALLNAMLHTIIEEGMVDVQYVQAHTEGYDGLRAKVRSFSPERMAPVCGIDAEVIREVARLYARSKASIIFWGMGVSQHTHGTDNSRCLIALALVTGQIGRPGTGLHPLRGQNNVQGASDAGLIPMVFPDYISVEDEEIRFEREIKHPDNYHGISGDDILPFTEEMLEVKAQYEELDAECKRAQAIIVEAEAARRDFANRMAKAEGLLALKQMGAEEQEEQRDGEPRHAHGKNCLKPRPREHQGNRPRHRQRKHAVDVERRRR